MIGKSVDISVFKKQILILKQNNVASLEGSGGVPIALWLTCWNAASRGARSNSSNTITFTFELISLGKAQVSLFPGYELDCITTVLLQGYFSVK